MKLMQFEKQRCAGLSRAGFLALVCAALAGVYLFFVYQKTGEVLQITWRKRVVKTNTPVQEVKTQTIVQHLESVAEDETVEISPSATTSSVPPVTTNANPNLRIEPPASENVAMRLPDKRKHAARIPTNSVWYSKPRNGPGMRIAFP